MENKEKGPNNSPAIKLTDKTNIVYTNQLVILGGNPEEIEIGIGVKLPDGTVEITHRLFTATEHFHRMATLFSKVSNDIREKESKKKKEKEQK